MNVTTCCNAGFAACVVTQVWHAITNLLFARFEMYVTASVNMRMLHQLL